MGSVYIPHPFDPLRNNLRHDVLDELVGDGLVDGIEVLNAKTSLTSLNARAARYAGEHGLAPGAGSDAHVAEALGGAYLEMPDFDDDDPRNLPRIDASGLGGRPSLRPTPSLETAHCPIGGERRLEAASVPDFAVAIVLGLLQGVTEFFPVSSSAHLEVVPWLAGWDLFDGDNELENAFDVALHVGTLVGAAVYLRADIARYANALWSGIRGRADTRHGGCAELGPLGRPRGAGGRHAGGPFARPRRAAAADRCAAGWIRWVAVVERRIGGATRCAEVPAFLRPAGRGRNGTRASSSLAAGGEPLGGEHHRRPVARLRPGCGGATGLPHELAAHWGRGRLPLVHAGRCCPHRCTIAAVHRRGSSSSGVVMGGRCRHGVAAGSDEPGSAAIPVCVVRRLPRGIGGCGGRGGYQRSALRTTGTTMPVALARATPSRCTGSISTNQRSADAART